MATTPRASGQQDQQTPAATTDPIRESAAKIGSDLKQEAVNQAERARQQTSDSMHTFAEAIRKAGDELAAKDQGPAAQLLGQAAGGLEQLSAALGRKRLDDIVGDVRRFGREHPGAFIAGSVLVGLALGRFAQASVANTGQTSHSRGDGSLGVPPGGTVSGLEGDTSNEP